MTKKQNTKNEKNIIQKEEIGKIYVHNGNTSVEINTQDLEFLREFNIDEYFRLKYGITRKEETKPTKEYYREPGIYHDPERDPYYEKKDDKSCYLTTACVSSRGLPDNCLELNVLRDFRDNVLMKTSKGKSAVKDYYRFAPDVVASIDSRVDSKQIWDSVYKDISHAVNLVQKGDFNAAFDHYKNMSNNLQKIYLK